MNLTWSMAWRNLWRHGRRTWLTVGAMVFCNVLLVFAIALQLGSYEMMINNSLASFTGHLQVQREGYKEEQKIRQDLPGVRALATEVRQHLGVETVAARASGFALASSDKRSLGVLIMGVEPQWEPRVSNLPSLVREGRYLSDLNGSEMVIGSVLARNLKVAVGEELTFLGSDRDGSMAVGIVTVVGIIDSGIPDIDRSLTQIPLGYFQESFAMGERGHAVVANLPSLGQVPQAVEQVRGLLAQGSDLRVLDWDALDPGLRQAIQADMSSAWAVYIVLILLVALSVLNTQLMSVMERTREFGVMMALGTSPTRLARLIMAETLVMGLLGMAIGVFIGGAWVYYLQIVGFTIPGMEEMLEVYALPGAIYPEFSLVTLFWGPGVVLFGTVIAAVYPASRLFRLNPLTAMKAV